MPSPGNENEKGQMDKEKMKEEEQDKENPPEKHSKTIGAKLRDALQDWSNDDARDIEEDDSSPLRSGL